MTHYDTDTYSIWGTVIRKESLLSKVNEILGSMDKGGTRFLRVQVPPVEKPFVFAGDSTKTVRKFAVGFSIKRTVDGTPVGRLDGLNRLEIVVDKDLQDYNPVPNRLVEIRLDNGLLSRPVRETLDLLSVFPLPGWSAREWGPSNRTTLFHLAGILQPDRSGKPWSLREHELLRRFIVEKHPVIGTGHKRPEEPVCVRDRELSVAGYIPNTWSIRDFANWLLVSENLPRLSVARRYQKEFTRETGR